MSTLEQLKEILFMFDDVGRKLDALLEYLDHLEATAKLKSD